MDIQELAMTAGRTAVIYVFLLVLLRLLGKRTVGNFTAFDLIVALMMGEYEAQIETESGEMVRPVFELARDAKTGLWQISSFEEPGQSNE